MIPLKVFVGWDSREDIAFQTLKHSIEKHTTQDIEVIPVKQYELRQDGIYKRPLDSTASTEFTLTRFLVPYLSNYQGYSLFMDCDMLLTGDISQIMHEADLTADVSCVQHDYEEIGKYLTDTKMDGKQQHVYPRKNWSSVMLFNNALCESLTPDVVNTASPAFLHRMNWADQIGSLHHRWNYLAGYYHDNDFMNIHFTDGGPWFAEYHDCPHGELWKNEIKEMFGI